MRYFSKNIVKKIKTIFDKLEKKELFVTAPVNLSTSVTGIIPKECSVTPVEGSSNGYLVAAVHPVSKQLPITSCLHKAVKLANRILSIDTRLLQYVPFFGLFKAAICPLFFYDLYLSGKEVSDPFLMAGALRHREGAEVVRGCDQFKKQCEDRASEIIDKVVPGSCMLIDFGNGQHTALLIRSLGGELEYFSYGATRKTWGELEHNFDWIQVNRKDKEAEGDYEAKKRILSDMFEEYDFIGDDRCVLLNGLDSEKMITRARKLFENQNYTQTGFNCSKFATEVMKAGFRRIHNPMQNMCLMQMPENAFRFARELEYTLKNHKDLLEDRIDQCRNLGALRRLHEGEVVGVKSSLRFRLKHFLYCLTGIRTAEEYRVNQLEKYIARHIIGSSDVKKALLAELNNEKGSDEQIVNLLSLLRLDADSIERVVKLNDPELLDFYLKYFCKDVNKRINEQQESMLLCAVRNQSNRIVRALLDRDDTDRRLCDKDGNTFLILAAKKGNEEAVSMSLLADPDVSETNNHGKTAIDMARKYHHHKVASLLESIVNQQSDSPVCCSYLTHALPDSNLTESGKKGVCLYASIFDYFDKLNMSAFTGCLIDNLVDFQEYSVNTRIPSLWQNAVPDLPVCRDVLMRAEY